MQEFEIYLPTTHNDGSKIDPTVIQEIRETLANAFGGYTHLTHHNAGVWKMGGVTFHDEVTIIRVLDDGSALFDMPRFKASLEQSLQQDSILIVARAVQVI